MEAQMHRPFAGHQEQSPHTGPNSGEVEHHHEKKSVLKKVKAKAKKIKDSIKHLGHDHEDEDEDDQEYDYEEMVDDPELHGAPIYESSAIRSGVLPNQDIGIMAPKSTSRREDLLDSSVSIEDKMRQFVHRTRAGRETDDNPAEHKSHVPHSSGIERTGREPGARFGVLEGLQEDPQAPMDKPNPSNYETKVTGPTGQSVEEIEVHPLIASFGKMTVEDETKSKSFPKQNNSYSGSHDQFSPEAIPASTQFGPESIPGQFDSGKPRDDMPSDPIDGKSPSGLGSGSYTDKISSAATLLVDNATTAKNAIASKLGYGDGTEEKGTHTSATPTKSPTEYGTEEKGTHTRATPTKSPTEYAHKAAGAVTKTLAPIYSKVAGVGNALVSKVPGISTEEVGVTESSTEANKTRGPTMKEYLAEKLKPGEEDKALSEVISDSLHPQKAAGEREGRRPMGQVTESEEVARRLGSGQENRREGTDALIAGSESSGNSVIDKFKDAVTSWVLKGGESPTSHQKSPPISLGNLLWYLSTILVMHLCRCALLIPCLFCDSGNIEGFKE
ncbi:hypothetical protein Leryth_018370 [Lithospermum erythrorhizon]|nr:hypothetical protein Leryth_018370 [Lithospermum erythrorhizon]